jgi:hypothetical protein
MVIAPHDEPFIYYLVSIKNCTGCGSGESVIY